MSFLTITEVSDSTPCLHFHLQLTENSYFAFGLLNTKKNRKKLWEIVDGLLVNINLWRCKAMKNRFHSTRIAYFSYENGIFYYYNSHFIVEIPVQKDHLKAIRLFLLSNPTYNRQCNVS